MTAYYNEIDPFCIRWLRRLMRAGAERRLQVADFRAEIEKFESEGSAS